MPCEPCRRQGLPPRLSILASASANGNVSRTRPPSRGTALDMAATGAAGPIPSRNVAAARPLVDARAGNGIPVINQQGRRQRERRASATGGTDESSSRAERRDRPRQRLPRPFGDVADPACDPRQRRQRHRAKGLRHQLERLARAAVVSVRLGLLWSPRPTRCSATSTSGSTSSPTRSPGERATGSTFSDTSSCCCRSRC